ncbi:MAG: hypothetical protein ACR2HR_15105 [Euzebya sp.]
MICPGCNATNSDTATFCGQCYGSFEAPPEPLTAPEEVPWLVTGAGKERRDPDGQVLWRCAVCATSNPATAYICEVCGAKMDAEAPDPDARPVDWAAARRQEMLVPGLVHIRTGRNGQERRRRWRQQPEGLGAKPR